jgi:hypothetical protein
MAVGVAVGPPEATTDVLDAEANNRPVPTSSTIKIRDRCFNIALLGLVTYEVVHP